MLSSLGAATGAYIPAAALPLSVLKKLDYAAARGSRGVSGDGADADVTLRTSLHLAPSRLQQRSFLDALADEATALIKSHVGA